MNLEHPITQHILRELELSHLNVTEIEYRQTDGLAEVELMTVGHDAPLSPMENYSLFRVTSLSSSTETWNFGASDPLPYAWHVTLILKAPGSETHE